MSAFGLIHQDVPQIQDMMVETWPDSHLGLREVQLAGQLCALSAHHVLAALKLHLQAIQLLRCEGGAGPLGAVKVQALGQDNFPDGPLGICKDREGSQVNPPVVLDHLWFCFCFCFSLHFLPLLHRISLCSPG